MPEVHVVDRTPVPTDRVLEAARDFSERRSELWPVVHPEHLVVHRVGRVRRGDRGQLVADRPLLGEVAVLPAGATIKGVVLDSTVFRPGSTWELRAAPPTVGPG